MDSDQTKKAVLLGAVSIAALWFLYSRNTSKSIDDESKPSSMSEVVKSKPLAHGKYQKPAMADLTMSQVICGLDVVSFISCSLVDECLIAIRRRDVQQFSEFWVSRGVKNLKGGKTNLTIMSDSIDGKESVSKLKAGESVCTLIDSDALILLIPLLNEISSNHLPTVWHSCGSAAESLIIRDIEGLCLLSSSTAQECHDLAIISYLTSIASKSPIINFFGYDVGSIPTHVRLFDSRLIKAAISNTELSHGNVGEIFCSISSSLSSIFGRQYSAFEYHGASDATDVIVMVGAVLTASAQDAIQKTKTGIVNVRVVRPWLQSRFIASLPSTVSNISVLDIALGDPIYADVVSSFHSSLSSKVLPRIVKSRLNPQGAALDVDDVNTLLYNLHIESPKNDLSVGCAIPFDPVVSAVKNNSENGYVQLLKDVIGERLNLRDAAIDGGAEIAFGAHLAVSQQRSRLISHIEKVLEKTASLTNSYKNSTGISQDLHRALKKWLETRDDAVLSKESTANVVNLLSSSYKGWPDLETIYEGKDLLNASSRWIVAGDNWAYDESYAGIHSVISSGESIKVLLLDGGKYSSLGNPRKSKKNLGLYAMDFGGVYVASIAIGDKGLNSTSEAAFLEADKFNGPALILAFSMNEVNTQETLQNAIATGEWPLYRWNPNLDKDDDSAMVTDPLTIDSVKIRDDLQMFIDKRNQLSLLVNAAPIMDPELSASMEKDLKLKHIELKTAAMNAGELASSFNKLNSSLSLPITILYASDGGKAEGVAKRLQAEGKKRGLNIAKCVAMDDFEGGAAALPTLEDSDSKQNKYLFSISTAGQGEMPHNGAHFWETLQKGGFDLSGIEYSVFSMGDSNYWEDKKYFAKAGIDLDEAIKKLNGKPIVPIGIGDDQHADGYEEGLAKWEALVWAALGVPNAERVVAEEQTSSKLDDDGIKIWSNYLRGTIAEGLEDKSTGSLVFEDTKITKFHGIYMQDNRDERSERRKLGVEKAFSFMCRVGLPGGVGTANQWLAFDKICDAYGNGDFKITTRQAFQLHGIVKKKLKPMIQAVNRAAMSSLAACGDVNRNTLASASPLNYVVHETLLESARKVDVHLKPRTGAYHEIWLDKKQVAGGPIEEEPMYGKTYLPRKFKIAFAVPPINDTDVFGQGCVGYIAIVENNKIVGYNVAIGGGMGMHHNNNETYPCLAQVMGFCTVAQTHEVAEMIMKVQRDFGDRKNRKHARLKYTLRDHGMDWFRDQVEQRLGYRLQAARPFVFTTNGDQYGFQQVSNDDKWSYCMYIENGRIIDRPHYKMRTGLREAATLFNECEFRLTANQNLIIANIPGKRKGELLKLLKSYGIDNDKLTGLRKNSMACVALPTCALALAESERYLPTLVDKLDLVIEETGLRDVDIMIRMTGCPNGCARPYMAEIAFVGRAPGIYNFYLGGGHNGQRLAKLYKEAVNEEEILAELSPIIRAYAKNRYPSENFGDFVIRKGYVAKTTDGPDFHLNLGDISSSVLVGK